MKNKIGIFAAILLALVTILGAVYFFLGNYYQGVYPAFIWVEDIYCTGKTPEEVNELLMERHPYEGVTLVDISGQELHISPEDVNLTYSYIDDLEILLQKRSGFNWWKSIYRPRHVKINGYGDFDMTMLENALYKWSAFNVRYDDLVNLVKTDNGYELDEKTVNLPNKEEIISVAWRALFNLETRVELENASEHWGASCYYDAVESLTNEQRHCKRLFEKIDEIQSMERELSFGDETVQLSRGDLSSFILTKDDRSYLIEDELVFDDEEADEAEEEESENPGKGYVIVGGNVEYAADVYERGVNEDNGFLVDDNGNLIISMEKMFDYAKGLSETYTSDHCLNRYMSGNGSEILVRETSKGDGTLVDMFAEYERLVTYFIGWNYGTFDEDKLTLNEDVKSYNAADKLGKTFICVNLHDQKLKYYVDGQVSMEMPVVTGNINKRRGTPAGVFDVYNKRYHTYLRGADYVSYVNYWLGVNEGVGIHDASWRKKFGEDIYKNDGSHGCINCPKDKMAELWEVVETGTPVILYY